ncbi:MAG: glycosyltransferase family 2 protein [Acidobacteriota bacterium]
MAETQEARQDGGPVLSIVIPVFNEERTIGQVIDRVLAAAPGLSKEVIVSNDGSRDGTSAVLADRARGGAIRVHDAPENRGKGAAIRAGLAMARGNIVLIQDADLEMDPADYPSLVEPILSGRADVVYGSRFQRRTRAGLATLAGNKALVAFTNFLYGTALTDMETAFKVFRRSVVTRLSLTCDRFDFEPEVSGKLLRAGYEIHEVPVSYAPRSRAEGKKVRWRDGIAAARVLLACRFAPRASILAGRA